MSEHIQPLLDRIRTEGIQQAEAERDRLLEQAREEARNIRETAETEARNIRSQAEADAETSRARGEAALAQASRDTLLQFRAELGRQLELLAKQAAGASLSSPDLVADILREQIRSAAPGAKLTLEAGSALAKTLESLLPALLKELGSSRETELVLNPRAGAGFKLSFSGSAAVADISDDAVATWLGALLRPELARHLRPAQDA
jgi:F0F1-type ATP synthase membrane subunit b/b'